MSERLERSSAVVDLFKMLESAYIECISIMALYNISFAPVTRQIFARCPFHVMETGTTISICTLSLEIEATCGSNTSPFPFVQSINETFSKPVSSTANLFSFFFYDILFSFFFYDIALLGKVYGQSHISLLPFATLHRFQILVATNLCAFLRCVTK